MPDRAASEVLGYVFVFSLILSTVAIVTVTGFEELESARAAEQFNNAERAFDVLHSNVGELYLKGVPSRATELSVGEATLQTGDPMWLNVTVVEGGDATTVERQLRPIEFTGIGNTVFVHEAGAVFRDDRSGGVVLEEPPFVFSPNRTVIPVVQTTSEGKRSVSGSTILVRTVVTDRTVAIADADPSTATYDDVVVNVTNSPRQELWLRYFEDDIGLDCETKTSPDAVVCRPSGVATDQVFVTVHHIRVELEQ